MKTHSKYWTHYILLACYGFVIVSGQFMAFGKLLNSAPYSSIAEATSGAQPFDARPILTQWRHVAPTSISETFDESINVCPFIVRSERKELVALPIIYTTVISHFPYPPFWPRDPSLV